MHTFIDKNSPELVELLAKAPLYKKFAEVRARKAIDGETITTTLEDGKIETVNTAHAGDWVIINPSGEEYILSHETFTDRYSQTSELGRYQSHEYCQAIANPFLKPIEIAATWGAIQRGDPNCFLAIACDKNAIQNGELYLIDYESFMETYEKVTELPILN
jgi:hypothetical protein